jgi:hypothetical protein
MSLLCASCGATVIGVDQVPDGWLINDRGQPLCPDCVASFRAARPCQECDRHFCLACQPALAVAHGDVHLCAYCAEEWLLFRDALDEPYHGDAEAFATRLSFTRDRCPD